MNETFYKNVRPVPRTMDEAYKTPSYAQAVWKYKSETSKGVRDALEWAAWFAICGLFVAVWTGFFSWIMN